MKYVCDLCGWEYDEEQGYPEGGIAPGTSGKMYRKILNVLCVPQERISSLRSRGSIGVIGSVVRGNL